MIEMLMVVCSMLASGAAVIWCETSWLDRFFARRHSLVLYWAYYLAKTALTAFLRYEIMYEGASWAEAANAVVVSIAALLTIAVTLYTWKGGSAQVFLFAFVCDLIATVLYSLVFLGVALVMGRGQSLASESIDPLLAFLATPPFLLLSYAVRVPVWWLLSFVKREGERHQTLWMLVGLLLAAYVTISNVVIPVSHADESLFYLLEENVAGSLFVALMLLLVIGRSRSALRRRGALAACEALAREYDSEVRAQLGELERDLATLAGHELVLEEIETNAADAETIREVRELEREYRRLCAGSYCETPALDAVLAACAGRLRALGVEPTFTVAGVPARAQVPVDVVYSLLGVVCEAAGRSREAAGRRVDLRVREVSGHPVLCLEAPREWGSLGARRRLTLLSNEETALVRETKTRERTEVLVMCPHTRGSAFLDPEFAYGGGW